jgi:HlyD family secretion protein
MKLYIIFMVLLMLAGCHSSPTREVETGQVKKGIFLVDLVEEGEINATNSINISSPAMSWMFGMVKIAQIVEDGEQVHGGDTVILFDASEVQKAILDAKAELEIARAELEKKRAEQQSKIEELKANIEISELSHQISEIKLEQATFEAEITRKEISLNLEKAKIALDKAKEEIVNQEKIHKEEIQQLSLKIKQTENNLAEAQTTLENLTVISPADGIAILRRNWATKNKWQVGDQTWSGNPLIDLPDLSELKVEAEISEVDISKVRLDQEVEIKLDAFSDTVFKGRIISIANLAKFKEEDSKIKIFPVEILLENTSDQFLPGMTVSCRIVIDRLENVLYIPLESLFSEGKNYFVYVKSGSSYDKKEVSVGEKNNDYIVIKDGIGEGELVALSDPYAKVELETD